MICFLFQTRCTFFLELQSVFSTNMVRQDRYKSTIRCVCYRWILWMKRRIYSFGSGTLYCCLCWLDCSSIGECDIRMSQFFFSLINSFTIHIFILMYRFQCSDHFNDKCTNEDFERTKSIDTRRYCTANFAEIGHWRLVAHLYAQSKFGSNHIQRCAGTIARTTGNA